MFATYVGKYKSIIISIALFVLLDASVLLLNFYTSFEIAEDALGVNLAGRQRMLSQRMVKSLLDIEFSSDDSVGREGAYRELALTMDLFDQTLRAFDQGGVAEAADGGVVSLAKVTSLKGREAIDAAKVLWLPYKKQLVSLLNTDEINKDDLLTSAISYGKANNLTLLTLMNNLTVDLENVAKSKAIRLRLIQSVGISLAIINFFIILFHFIGELRKGDKKLELARDETRKIMDTVNEGLFLIDQDFSIASQHSKKVSLMFGKSDISNYSFEQLLTELVSSRDLETSKRFISLLFRPDIKSNLISDLNPLREIEVNIADEMGGYTSKYLSFAFSRAYHEASIKNILVTVNDVTDKVKLERELAAVREQTQQHLEVLTGILHTNPIILKRFVNSCFERFHRTNLLLREQAKSESALRKKLNDIFIEIHSVKGEAGALSLESFEELAHKFENDIVDIRHKKQLSGDDFFPLVVQLDHLIRHAETVQELSGKLAAFAENDESDAKIKRVHVDEWEHLFQLTETVAKRNKKKVSLVTTGLSEVPLGDNMRKLVNDISIQCVRNAICHGIEHPEERLEMYKNEMGRIDIRLSQLPSGSVELSIEDDGSGINYDALRTRALETGNWSEQELEGWDTKRLVSLIFEPGFSTAKSEDLDVGRGVGMDLIKERIKAVRGKIRISSRRGSSTHFLITIPPPLCKTQEGEIAA